MGQFLLYFWSWTWYNIVINDAEKVKIISKTYFKVSKYNICVITMPSLNMIFVSKILHPFVHVGQWESSCIKTYMVTTTCVCIQSFIEKILIIVPIDKNPKPSFEACFYIFFEHRWKVNFSLVFCQDINLRK